MPTPTSKATAQNVTPSNVTPTPNQTTFITLTPDQFNTLLNNSHSNMSNQSQSPQGDVKTNSSITTINPPNNNNNPEEVFSTMMNIYGTKMQEIGMQTFQIGMMRDMMKMQSSMYLVK